MNEDKPNLELQLKELETIVAQLETDSLPLETSMQQYEKGIAIAKSCQQTLDNATQRIEKLNNENNSLEKWDTDLSEDTA